MGETEMPELNEIAMGTSIGYKSREKFIYLACSECGKPRWVEYKYAQENEFKTRCRKGGCARKALTTKLFNNDPTRWDGISEPQLGMKCRADKLGKRGYVYLVYDICPECKKLFWRTKESVGKLCGHCHNVKLYKSLRGEKNGQWRGGRYMRKDGYIILTIQPDDPYYSMAENNDGRVFEHKYLYAKLVAKRPLESWEVVHHIGTKFPQSSKENRSDNRLENLLYMPSQADHHVYSLMSQEINKLRKKIKELEDKLGEQK